MDCGAGTHLRTNEEFNPPQSFWGKRWEGRLKDKETITELFFVANLRHFVRAEDGRRRRPDISGYAEEDGRRRSRNGADVAGEGVL